MRWDRKTEGHELGALVVNIIISLGSLIIAMVVVLVVTYPGIDVLRTTIVFVGASVVVPTIMYPISFTLWNAIDLRIRPPLAEELADMAEAAEAARAAMGDMSSSAPTGLQSGDVRPDDA
jgi:hypothetical protein